MRNQHFTPEQFKAAAQLFGELHPHDKKERHVAGHLDVEYISNDETMDGKRIIPGETFHTDHSNHPPPPKATTLFAVELPTSGGDTQYINMRDAYDDLPEATKQKIGSTSTRATALARSARSARKVAAIYRHRISIRWVARIPRIAARHCS
jgi:taurine dioxygenase